MKYIVVILLLSTSGIEEVKLKHHGNCEGIANAWVDVNMKYYNERNNNPKLQGWYNSDGKLLLGWICN
tara:strand:- start:64 stop:267 length:204 start_codon:yes stop_codon:yes gene_type:complete